MRVPNLLKLALLLALLPALTACVSARERERRREVENAPSLRNYTPEERRALRIGKQDRAHRDWVDSVLE